MVGRPRPQTLGRRTDRAFVPMPHQTGWGPPAHPAPSPRFRPHSARGSEIGSPRALPPFSPAGRAPLRPVTAVRPTGQQSPRRSFMGPCPPSPRVPTARPEVVRAKPKKMRNLGRWQTSHETEYMDFVKKKMVAHLPQFDIPPLPEGELPPLTPQQKERQLMKKEPAELAEELKNNVFYSDIFNRLPPPPGYIAVAVLQPAEVQVMREGDNRPKWRW